MRLKHVRIFGFKTFADRTEFDLEGGFVAVVGPNGCGKSNLVDAILWGLGEGSARQLRAATSQDVIFSGSANRKAVGFAEVTLVFDNEDGALPLPHPEVSVTRRLNRAGESEYAINKQPCRLRDILELLADSGLGRAGYAIVGQKDIDQALAASADDRRAWVDEAAGVMRYRSRKIESLRRLNQATTHLQRVTDILAEIESQREPLKEEAEVAIRYKSVLGSLREVESGLLIQEIARSVHELEEARTKLQDAESLIEKESSLADHADAAASKASDDLRRLHSELEALRQQHQTALMSAERAAGTVRLGEQKLQALKDLEANLGQESGSFQTRIDEASTELAQVREESAAEEANLTRIREESAGADTQAKTLAGQLAEIEKRVEIAREANQRRLRAEAERAHADERAKMVRRELKGIEATFPDLDQGLREAEAGYQTYADQIAKVQANADQASTDLTKLDEADRTHDQRRRTLLAEQSTLVGRRQGLEMTIEAHEGLQQGARAVLEAVKEGLLPDEYEPVGEAITVPRDLALAIETALGGAANDLIVPDSDAARRAINLLREHRLGRATFQPVPLMRPPEITSELKRVLDQRGVVGRASEKVEIRSAFRPVIDSLLGRVVIVETLDDALRLAKTTGWSRLVTLDGEVVHSAGAVTGGQSAKGGYGLVQRRADLAEIDERLAVLERDLKKHDRAIAERTLQRATLQAQLAELIAQRKQIESEAQDAREWLQSVRDEHASTLKAKSKLEAELAALSQRSLDEVKVEDLAVLEGERDDVIRKLAARQADAATAEGRLREAEERVQQAQLRVEMAVRRHQAATEQAHLREKKLGNLGPELSRTQSEITQAQAEHAAAEQLRTRLETDLAAAEQRRQSLTDVQLAKLEEAKRARQNAAGLTEAQHQTELARARADARRSTALERLLEEYGLNEAEALAQAEGIEVPKDAATLVSRLRRELKSMGEVNLGAVEAYERLTSRSVELAEQLNDVESGMEEIRSSIRELDRLTRDKFLDTFARVQTAFADLFTKLFGGGEGALSLTDPDNVLESGLEIEVTLPGKKRQSLALLSGGERSLCATAFLFALLRVKPSPLVVLDEVDAPLDGRNVERFVDLLQEFAKDMQFIVITHNPTTIESAPIWLGVTMTEPGISMLIPTRVQPALAEAAVVHERHSYPLSLSTDPGSPI